MVGSQLRSATSRIAIASLTAVGGVLACHAVWSQRIILGLTPTIHDFSVPLAPA